jgi:hypothetical protein
VQCGNFEGNAERESPAPLSARVALAAGRGNLKETEKELKMENKEEKVLLVENGLNRCVSGCSFDELMEQLIKQLDLQSKVKMDKKPLPLLYEEIYARYHASVQDAELLQKVANAVKDIKHDPLHDEVWTEYKTVLTTNYDYNLEGENPSEWKGGDKERIYDLFRKRTKGEQTVWYIHGEAEKPTSICLGFKRYIDTTGRLRSYLDGRLRPYSSEEYELSKKLKRFYDENKTEGIINSWADYFFFSDMDILGLDFGTSEIDLWWILTCRNRLMKSEQNFKNVIRYYYCPTEGNKEEAAKLQLLEAVGVEVMKGSLGQQDDKWHAYYLSILKPEKAKGTKRAKC